MHLKGRASGKVDAAFSFAISIQTDGEDHY